MEYAILVVVDEVRSHAHIFQLQFGITSEEIAFTSHTTQTPKSWSSSHEPSHQRNVRKAMRFLPLLQVWSDVEFGCYLTVFCITGELAIYVEIDVGSNATEVGYYLLAVPVFGILMMRR